MPRYQSFFVIISALVLLACNARHAQDKSTSSTTTEVASPVTSSDGLTCDEVAAKPGKHVGRKVSWFGTMVGYTSEIHASGITTVNAWECRTKDGQPTNIKFLAGEGTWTPAAGKVNSFKTLFHVVGIVKDTQTVTIEGNEITAVYLEGIQVELASEAQVKPKP